MHEDKTNEERLKRFHLWQQISEYSIDWVESAMVCENWSLLNNVRDLGRNCVDTQKLQIPAIFVMKCGLKEKKSYSCKSENSWRDCFNFNISLEISLVLLKDELAVFLSHASDCFMSFTVLQAKAVVRLNYLTAPVSRQTTHIPGLIFTYLVVCILTCSI